MSKYRRRGAALFTHIHPVSEKRQKAAWTRYHKCIAKAERMRALDELRLLILKAGVTIRPIEEACGVSPGYIANFMNAGAVSGTIRPEVEAKVREWLKSRENQR